jgi:hypothetical protein
LGVQKFELMFTRQVLYHLSHPPRAFCFSYFSYKASHFSAQAGLNLGPPTYAPHITGMTGAYHHAQLFCQDESLVNFLPRLVLNCYPPDFCLPSSCGWCEPLCPAHFLRFLKRNMKQSKFLKIIKT